jgi:hypothetical protein
VVECGSKNGHQQDICLTEIGLRAPNLLTILYSTVNRTGGNLYDYLSRKRILTLIMIKIFI